jgi:hypothetical protein
MEFILSLGRVDDGHNRFFCFSWSWDYLELFEMKAPGATLPRLTSKKKLSKSKAEGHSHAKGPPTGSIESILFQNFFETDLSVVTIPKFFHKMLRTFTTEAPFF